MAVTSATAWWWFGLGADGDSASAPSHPHEERIFGLVLPYAEVVASDLRQWTNPTQFEDALSILVDTDAFLDFHGQLLDEMLTMTALGCGIASQEPPGIKKVVAWLSKVLPGWRLKVDRLKLAEAMRAQHAAQTKVAVMIKDRPIHAPAFDLQSVRAAISANDMPDTIRLGFYGTLESEALLLALVGMTRQEVSSPSIAWSRTLVRLFLERAEQQLRMMALQFGPMRWIGAETIDPPSPQLLTEEVAAHNAALARLLPVAPQ